MLYKHFILNFNCSGLCSGIIALFSHMKPTQKPPSFSIKTEWCVCSSKFSLWPNKFNRAAAISFFLWIIISHCLFYCSTKVHWLCKNYLFFKARGYFSVEKFVNLKIKKSKQNAYWELLIRMISLKYIFLMRRNKEYENACLKYVHVCTDTYVLGNGKRCQRITDYQLSIQFLIFNNVCWALLHTPNIYDFCWEYNYISLH